MPCYLLTYHGYATWMPDHRRGYVHRTDGLKSSDPAMAQNYRRQMQERPVAFTPEMQRLLIDTARAAGSYLDARIHAVATEPTHVHVLVSWHGDRPWVRLRASVRSAMTRELNHRIGKRTWFADSPSRKRVGDRAHFEYLTSRYLPKHAVCWVEGTGAA